MKYQLREILLTKILNLPLSFTVVLSGKDPESFAEEQSLKIVDPSDFFKEGRFNSLQRI